MAALRYPSTSYGPNSRLKALKKQYDKNSIGQSRSEQALINRGPWVKDAQSSNNPALRDTLKEKPKFAPTGPLRQRVLDVSKEKALPAPSRLKQNGMFATRGTRAKFLTTHPVLASKKGEARDIFLANHPKINANNNEFKANAKTRRQQAVWRRLQRSL